jgi:four helix bundle protein
VAKLGTVIEECDETGYWLELLAEAGVCTSAAIRPSQAEADELLRIMAASQETVRRRLRVKRTKSQIANRESQMS